MFHSTSPMASNWIKHCDTALASMLGCPFSLARRALVRRSGPTETGTRA